MLRLFSCCPSLRSVALSVSLWLSLAAGAQTTNYALHNNGGQPAQASTLTELNGAAQATFQCWVRPDVLADAQLITQDNVSVGMTASGAVTLRVGQAVATAPADLQAGRWTQLTVVYNAGAAQVFVNGASVAMTGTLPPTIPVSAYAANKGGCTLGASLRGDIDEVRVWTVDLPAGELWWNNTLNIYHPRYAALAAYWKCDQDLCATLVDYCGKHHALLGDMIRQAVTDNAVMRYRVVTGYTSLMRYQDRPKISPEMFRMTNDVILLSGIIGNDGTVVPEIPDNSGDPVRMNQLAEWQGRHGVMHFQGQGAALRIRDNGIPYDPTSNAGRGNSQSATIEGWVYIDKWTEGAALFSNYKDADNCWEVRLGSEDTHQLVVDVNGTVGTLSGVLQAGRWMYVSVSVTAARTDNLQSRFFNPYSIGVGYYDEGGEFVSNKYTKLTPTKVVYSGKNMDLSYIPRIDGAQMTLGKNLDGYMDDVMLWGSNRSNAFASDAVKGFKWNSGVWDDIFLNAFWTGDDADAPGRDSQSLIAIAQQMRTYTQGYRGQRVRLGIIYHGTTSWKTVFSNDANLDRLVASLKPLVAHFDGLDVDLEWMYSSYDWQVYNKVVRRLADDVMAHYPGKIYSNSLHTVSYSGYDRSLIDRVDYFTFQMYGPQAVTYQWNYFPDSYEKFTAYGFPKDKILLSYGILLVNNGEEGYKDLFEKYGMNDSNYDPNLNVWNCNGTNKYFNGVNQIKRKMEYVIEKDVRGTMYFDMGNDQPVTDRTSLIRAQNSVVSANVDTLVTEAPVNFVSTNVESVMNKAHTVYYQSATGTIVTTAPAGAAVAVTDAAGRILWQGRAAELSRAFTHQWTSGVYMVRLTVDGRSTTHKIMIH